MNRVLALLGVFVLLIGVGAYTADPAKVNAAYDVEQMAKENAALIRRNKELAEVSAHKEFLRTCKKDLKKGQVFLPEIGHTAEFTIACGLGKPTSINRTTYANGVREQWVYRNYDYYLYFVNGVLTSFQNTK